MHSPRSLASSAFGSSLTKKAAWERVFFDSFPAAFSKIFYCSVTTFPVAFSFFLSYIANIPASNVPEMECHVQDTAQIIADSGVEANCAVVVARFVASPAFCIPTSMEMVLFFDVFMPTSFPAPYPSRYPSPL